MKKILLCLFLLTTINFYSQVNDIIHCSDDTTFNLTTQNALLIGSLNPNETTVSYHLTLDDATNGINAIANPANYISTEASKMIYARIDNNGIITTNYFNIVVNSLLTATAVVVEPVSCISNGTITAIASGGQAPYLYSLDYGATYTAVNTFSNITPGEYAIFVKDAIGCSCLHYIMIDPPMPLAITATVANVSCNGANDGSITINASGGLTPYMYSLNGAAYESNGSFSNLTAGSYNIQVKDANGCMISNVSMISQPIAPLSITTVHTDVTCSSNGSITITAIGGQAPYVYSIDNGVTYTANSTFSNLVSGTYNIYAKDNNGCIATNFVTLVPPIPLAIATVWTSVSCNGASDGSISVHASGGSGFYLFSLSNGVFISGPQSSTVYTNLAPGMYTVTVTDSYGCTSTISIMITEPAPLTITTSVNNINCHGDNSGLITINATGGNAPYGYSLDGIQFLTSNNFSSLTAGNYSTYVKDANGCMIYNVATITQPLLPLTVTITVTNATFSGVNDGSITINATGGQGIIKYAISPNLNVFATNSIFSNLASGAYDVIVQDENGCFFRINFAINPPAPLVNGSNAITQNFKEGQTLADLLIPGENIKWYSTPSATTNKLTKAAETSLPLSTVLVNNTTYYASQTINGIESTERLAVTVQLISLSTQDFILEDFRYYPNPVKDFFAFSNTSIIDEVSLSSITGATVLYKKINSLRSEIDLSDLSSGIYFLKVKSEGRIKTIKIIKE